MGKGHFLQHKRLRSCPSSVREHCHPSVSPLQPGNILSPQGSCQGSCSLSGAKTGLMSPLQCRDSLFPQGSCCPLSGMETAHPLSPCPLRAGVRALVSPQHGDRLSLQGSCPLSGAGTARPLGLYRDKPVLSGLVSHQGPFLIRAGVPSPAWRQPVPWARVSLVPVSPRGPRAPPPQARGPPPRSVPSPLRPRPRPSPLWPRPAPAPAPPLRPRPAAAPRVLGAVLTPRRRSGSL